MPHLCLLKDRAVFQLFHAWPRRRSIIQWQWVLWGTIGDWAPLSPHIPRRHKSKSAGQKCWVMCCTMKNGANWHPVEIAMSTAGVLDWCQWQIGSAPWPIPAWHTRHRRTDSKYAECTAIKWLPLVYKNKSRHISLAMPVSGQAATCWLRFTMINLCDKLQCAASPISVTRKLQVRLPLFCPQVTIFVQVIHIHACCLYH